MASVKIFVSPWAPDVEPLAHEVAANGLPADSTMIYNGRRNKVVKLNRENRDINIKAFRVPNIVNRIVYGTFRFGKARRSYEHALRLRNLGFNTPEPLAYIELSKGPLFGRSYYICQQLEGFRDMRSLEGHDISSLIQLADCLGLLIARLHDAGIWMKDFSQGNLLYRPVAKGRFEFFLIDINRMEFDVTDRKKLMKNFDTITDDDKFLTLLSMAYAQHTGQPKEEVLRTVINTRINFLARKENKEVFKKVFRV